MAERESSLEQRERQDAEKEEYRVARQVRLGHIEAPKKKTTKKKTETEETSESE